MIPIRRLFFLFISLAASGPLQAQPEQDYALQTDFTCLALDKEIKGLKILSAGEVRAINIYSSTRSRKINYRGAKQLTFFRESETPGPDGQPVRTPVGQINLDGTYTRYLLLFAKHAGDTESYSIYPIPDTTEQFKAGTYRFLNLAPFKIAVKIGESKHLLTEKDITDVIGNFEHGNYYQTIMLSLPGSAEEAVPAYSGRIHFNEHMRMLYIIRPKEDAKSGKITFAGIPERMPPQ